MILMCCQAVELSPFSPTVRANLALARQNAGYLEFALVDYEAVMSMDPGSVQHAISLAGPCGCSPLSFRYNVDNVDGETRLFG